MGCAIVWTAAISIAGTGASNAVSIDYAAPAACPRVDGFATELSVRTPRTRVVTPAPHVRALIVRVVAARGGGFDGRLFVREPSGSETERVVTADSCADVVSALAVIAAVAIDPLAAAETATASASSAPAALTTSTTSSSNVDAAPAPVPDVRRTVSPAHDDGREAQLPDAGGEAVAAPPLRGWAFATGAHAGVVHGVSPDTRVLLALFVEVADETRRLFAPAVRLRLERTLGGTAASSGASGDFTWTAASLDLCPIAATWARFGARPCLRVEAGALEARGVDVIPSRHGTSPWLALGPVVRGRVELVGPLFVELDLATTLAIVRDRFFVEPASTVFRAPVFGWAAAAGAGVVFW